MVELLKIVVETISGALPGIKKKLEDEKRAALGTNLLLLYIDLQRTHIAACRIVGSLQGYVGRYRSDLAEGLSTTYVQTAGTWIERDVREQIVNLGRVQRSLSAVLHELLVIDSDAYKVLDVIIDGKVGALTRLINGLAKGHVPLGGPSMDDVRRAAHDSIARHWVTPVEASEPVQTTHVHQPWDEAVLVQVEAYLSERDPGAQLKSMEEKIDQLHESLARHFTFEDLIVGLADQRENTRRWLRY